MRTDCGITNFTEAIILNVKHPRHLNSTEKVSCRERSPDFRTDVMQVRLLFLFPKQLTSSAPSATIAAIAFITKLDPVYK